MPPLLKPTSLTGMRPAALLGRGRPLAAPPPTAGGPPAASSVPWAAAWKDGTGGGDRGGAAHSPPSWSSDVSWLTALRLCMSTTPVMTNNTSGDRL